MRSRSPGRIGDAEDRYIGQTFSRLRAPAKWRSTHGQEPKPKPLIRTLASTITTLHPTSANRPVGNAVHADHELNARPARRLRQKRGTRRSRGPGNRRRDDLRLNVGRDVVGRSTLSGDVVEVVVGLFEV